jgi:peptide/nickel transport system permease protein
MLRFIGMRLVSTIPVLVIVSLLVFIMIHLTPGDPVMTMLGQTGASAERVESIREELGLNEPLPVQYVHFMRQMLTGEIRSIRTRQPVIQEFMRLFPSTLELAFWSLVIATIIGLPLGVVAATRQHTWVDNTSMAISFLGVSIPSFWLALILIYIFAQGFGWVPATGSGSFRHLILPAAVLAFQQVALIARIVRGHMIEALHEDYVRTARAKGLGDRAVEWRHALKNALLPTITLQGLNLSYLLSGAVIIETVFARPGIGRMIVDGILAKDFPLVQGAVLMTALLYVLVNLITDISYAFVDPRIRY